MFSAEDSKGQRMFTRKWNGLYLFQIVFPCLPLSQTEMKCSTRRKEGDIGQQRVQVACLTVQCNPNKIQGSWVQLVGLFRSFQHARWLKRNPTLRGEFTDTDWLRGWERKRDMERLGEGGGGMCVWEESEWQLRRGEAGERGVNVVKLTDRLETVGY